MPFFRKKTPLGGDSSPQNRPGWRLRGLIFHLSHMPVLLHGLIQENMLPMTVYERNISGMGLPSRDSTDYQPIPHSISPHVPVLLSFKKDTHVPTYIPIYLYFQEILRKSPEIASEERWISVMYWTIWTTNSFQLLWRQGWSSEVEAGNNINFCMVCPVMQGPTMYRLHMINCDTFRTLWTFYKTCILTNYCRNQTLRLDRWCWWRLCV